MKHIHTFFLVFFSVLIYGQQYKIFNQNQEEISLPSMSANLMDSEVIFFGEVHDDSIGHVAQLDILKSLKTALKEKIALSLEMFETDVQLVVDEYLDGYMNEDSFIKDARAWNTYLTAYKPLVETMKADRLDVIAANAPRRYVKMVTKNGLSSLNKLSKQAKSYLAKLPITVAKGRYEEKFAAIMEDHNMSGNTIYQSQNLWDATMAKSIFEYTNAHKGNKVLHVCGRFHCEESLGTVAQLKRLNQKVKTTVIVSLPMSEYKDLSMEDRQKLGDYLVVTEI